MDLPLDPTAPGGTTFSSLKLAPALLANVAREGYDVATPVQEQAIPHILAGTDILGSAPTGTGKTAAFTLPVLQRLGKGKTRGATKSGGKQKRAAAPIRCLVLAPTRELAIQISDSFTAYGRGTGLRHTTIFGGVGQMKQVRDLRNGVDILIATPGRLLDLMGQGHIHLGRVEVFILDEADRMLDMGFIPAVRQIAAEIPDDRQTLLFSATVPPTIQKLVKELLDQPQRIEIAPEQPTAELVTQGVMFVKKADKPELLAHVLQHHNIDSAIVFSRTKHGADRVVKQLGRRNIDAVAIHGNKNQNQRQRALASFKSGRSNILVATDVAARGIDVDGVTHVINYDLTHEPETYVHRIGRTGRAGADGIAISFCDETERAYLKDIQKLLGWEIPVKKHPFTDGKQRVEFKPPQRKTVKKAAKPKRKPKPHPLDAVRGKPAGQGGPRAKSGKAGKPSGRRNNRRKAVKASASR